MTTPVATNTNNIATTTMAIFGMPDDVCAGTGAACAGTVSALTVTAVTDSSEECRGAASRLVVAVIDGGTAATLAAEVETAGEIVAPTTTGVPHLLQNFTPPTSSMPHFVQRRGTGPVAIALSLRVPHFVQNGPDSVSAAPHCLQELSISVHPI